MTTMEVLHVFTDDHGDHGGKLAIIDDTAVPDSGARQRLAADIGFSETVFIDSLTHAAFQIFTPQVELPFAGHPCIGVAWYIAQQTGATPGAVRPPAGEVPAWADGELTWIRGPLTATPEWWHERLDDPADVDALSSPLVPKQDATQLWAWINQREGSVRARVFAARYGIAQDEACGSTALRLAAALGQRLTIRHGQGSIVHPQPGPSSTAEIGGRVKSIGQRTITRRHSPGVTPPQGRRSRHGAQQAASLERQHHRRSRS